MLNIQIIEKLIPKSDKILISFGKVYYEDRFFLILATIKIFDVDFIIVKLDGRRTEITQDFVEKINKEVKASFRKGLENKVN